MYIHISMYNHNQPLPYYLNMKRINFFMVSQWIIFAPIIIPISLITGAFEGLRRTLNQAADDIFQLDEVSS